MRKLQYSDLRVQGALAFYSNNVSLAWGSVHKDSGVLCYWWYVVRGGMKEEVSSIWGLPFVLVPFTRAKPYQPIRKAPGTTGSRAVRRWRARSPRLEERSSRSVACSARAESSPPRQTRPPPPQAQCSLRGESRRPVAYKDRGLSPSVRPAAPRKRRENKQLGVTRLGSGPIPRQTAVDFGIMTTMDSSQSRLQRVSLPQHRLCWRYTRGCNICIYICFVCSAKLFSVVSSPCDS